MFALELGVAHLLLLLISIGTQVPIPVAQAAIGAKTLSQAVLVTMAGSTVAAAVFVGIVSTPKVPLSFDSFDPMEGAIAVWMLVSATLNAVANPLIFWSAARLGPARFIIGFSVRIIPVPLIDFVFLDEKLRTTLLIGIPLIVASIAFSKRAEVRQARVREEAQPSWTSWLVLLVGAGCFGSAVGIDAIVLKSVETPTYVPIRLLLPVVILAALYPLLSRVDRHWLQKQRPEPLELGRKLRALSVVVVCVPISSATLLWAVELSEQPTTLNALHQLSIFGTMALVAWRVKRIRAKKPPEDRSRGESSGDLRSHLIAAFLAVLGVIFTIGALG